MLTPQDIQGQEFSKAVFGGYDMTVVDDFLEKVNSDYAALYKENAILKGKIKVLVEKVEEYRSTEDAMRMALLTAQKMGDDIISETRKKTDQQLEEANREIELKKASFEKEYANEIARLEAAKAQTLKFIQASQEIMQQHEAFLTKLSGATQEIVIEKREEPDDEAELVHSPEPEPHREPIPEDDEDIISRTMRDIDSVVSEVLESGDREIEEPEADEPTQVISAPAEEEAVSVDDSPTRRIVWTEEDEIMTPRPKFDFSDLKFGTNYSEED